MNWGGREGWKLDAANGPPSYKQCAEYRARGRGGKGREGKRVRARKGRGKREAYRGLPGTVLAHKHDHGFRVKLGVRKRRRIEGVIHVHLG